MLWYSVFSLSIFPGRFVQYHISNFPQSTNGPTSADLRLKAVEKAVEALTEGGVLCIVTPDSCHQVPCHGSEEGPLFIYHQHEAPADFRICITHIGFRLVTLISSPPGSWVWGYLACLRWFKIKIIPTLSSTLQHLTIAKSMCVFCKIIGSQTLSFCSF